MNKNTKKQFQLSQPKTAKAVSFYVFVMSLELQNYCAVLHVVTNS